MNTFTFNLGWVLHNQVYVHPRSKLMGLDWCSQHALPNSRSYIASWAGVTDLARPSRCIGQIESILAWTAIGNILRKKRNIRYMKRSKNLAVKRRCEHICRSILHKVPELFLPPWDQDA